MKKIVTGPVVAALILISTPISAEESRAKDVVHNALRARGWQLDWQIDRDFITPLAAIEKGATLGGFLRDVFRPFVAMNRDVSILVCEDNKQIIVFREMVEENVDSCKRLFNRMDFEI